MLATYDAKNPAALRRLIAAGPQLRPFPQDTLEAAFKATAERMADIGAASPTIVSLCATHPSGPDC
jgi:TRAP-type mannitol/chloroaromatic compound transport system substrate-binding protein